jgi:ketosteroid isomerase-like protein
VTTTQSDPTTRSLEERLDEVESRAAIADLIAGYCEGVDRRDLERFLGIWHDDAEYLIPGGRGDFVGKDEIRRSQEVIGGVWKSTYHWTTNHTASFETSDRATGRSDAFAMCVHQDDRVSWVACSYHDVYERRAGSWKLARRLVERYFVSAPQDVELRPPY